MTHTLENHPSEFESFVTGPVNLPSFLRQLSDERIEIESLAAIVSQFPDAPELLITQARETAQEYHYHGDINDVRTALILLGINRVKELLNSTLTPIDHELRRSA